ncbi:MAG: hypothetical protein E6892_02095, partial [Streptococcus mitis]|nr:hypothetical protein [Streptococcus mitis]MDU1468721.1 hypothetical protein [Streptococcus mitis]
NTIRERLKIKKLEFRYWRSLAFLWLRTILSQVQDYYFNPLQLTKSHENTQKRLLTKLFLSKKQFRKQASTIPTYDECSR